MQIVLQPWSEEKEEVLRALSTSHAGLSLDESKKRLKKFGSNIFHSKEKKSIFSIFIKLIKYQCNSTKKV